VETNVRVESVDDTLPPFKFKLGSLVQDITTCVVMFVVSTEYKGKIPYYTLSPDPDAQVQFGTNSLSSRVVLPADNVSAYATGFGVGLDRGRLFHGYQECILRLIRLPKK
jgi:hypothetical protein